MIVTDLITIQLPSKSMYLDWVHTVSSALVNQTPLPERKSHFLLVAISEGFTNAVLHGNSGDSSRQVKLMYTLGSDFIQVEVEDEGIVPINNSIDDLIRPVDQADESGRGLDLMKQVIDEVSIRFDSGRGNILALKQYFENDSVSMTVRDGEVKHGSQGKSSR